MADLDKMFAEMAQEEPEDTSCDYRIDEDLRVIAIPERGVVLGVEGDKDVNRVRFHMNRMWRGNDLSTYELRINYENAAGDRNYYTVVDKTVIGNTVMFDWLVAADAVAYKGDVWFIVVGLVTAGGVVKQAFHTTLGTAKCLQGLAVDTRTDIPEIRDFLATLKEEVTGYAQAYVDKAKNSADAAKTSETNSAASAKAAKTSETNAGISASTASTKAEEAETAAAAAKTSETNADNIAKAAKADADKAHSDAEKAEAAKNTAEQDAAATKTNAESARADAERAETAQTAAETSAQAAKASENHSADSADLARGHETQAGFYANAAQNAVDKSIEGYSGGYSRTVALTAPKENWEEMETPIGIYRYSVTVPLEDCTEKWNVFAAVMPESYPTIYKARIANVVETLDGAVKLYAVNAPEENIAFTLSVFAVGSQTYYVTAPADGWTAVENAVGSRQWQCDVALEDATAKKVPMGFVALENTNEMLADPCLCATMETFDGYVRLYAMRKPAMPINLIVILLARNEVT